MKTNSNIILCWLAFLIIILGIALFVASMTGRMHSARSDAQSKTPEPKGISVYVDEQRGATCYILKDNVSCLPSQWLYVDEMFLGEKQ